MHAIACYSRPPPYEIFFGPLKIVLDPQELEAVEFAYQASKHGHATQVRDDGTRYFDHPKGATWIYIHELGGHDCRVIIVTLMHDLPEESKLLSAFRIKMNFGEDIALDVFALTKYKHAQETTEDYLSRILLRGPWAILAKLLDRLHNVRTMEIWPLEVRKAYAKETLEYHLPILISALRTSGGQWATYADILDNLIKDAIEPYREARSPC